MDKGSESGDATHGLANAGRLRIFGACAIGILVPGLGHALLRKWGRALIFLFCICLMFVIGLRLQGRLFPPDLSDAFSFLKFAAEAGSGLPYWYSLAVGLGPGEPAAYTYDYGNVFIYVAGLLNMLVVIDAFDIGMGRKK